MKLGVGYNCRSLKVGAVRNTYGNGLLFPLIFSTALLFLLFFFISPSTIAATTSSTDDEVVVASEFDHA